MRLLKNTLPHLISIFSVGLLLFCGWCWDIDTSFLVAISITWLISFVAFSFQLLRVSRVIKEAVKFFSIDPIVKSKTKAVLEAIRISQQKLEITASQIRQINILREAQPIHPLIAKDAIGLALNEVQVNISRLKREEDNRHWIAQGLSKFGELIRVKDNSVAFCTRMVSNLVRYTNSNQGVFFLLKENEEEGQYLELAACYAYDRERFVEKKIYPGQGVVGQCLYEKDVIFLTDIPSDYIKITSGLGLSTPRNIIVIPLMANENVFGVIELASFEILEQHQIDFLKEVSKSIAAELESRQNLETTNKLLKDSIKLTNELQVSEAESCKQQAALDSYLLAINNTIATAEFDLAGNFISANDIFLKIMGYTLAEIKCERYNTSMVDVVTSTVMWDNLRSGKFFAGEFKMRDRGGKEKWLSGTFNPIFIQSTVPDKIMMCAQFTTEEKEKLNDLNVMVNALKSCLPIIEFTDSFKCKTANDKFMKMFNVSRVELRNKTIYDFIDIGYTEFFNSIKSEILQKDSATLVLPFYKDGAHVTYEVSASVVRDSAGALSRVIIILVRELEQRIPVLTAVR